MYVFLYHASTIDDNRIFLNNHPWSHARAIRYGNTTTAVTDDVLMREWIAKIVALPNHMYMYMYIYTYTCTCTCICKNKQRTACFMPLANVSILT